MDPQASWRGPTVSDLPRLRAETTAIRIGYAVGDPNRRAGQHRWWWVCRCAIEVARAAISCPGIEDGLDVDVSKAEAPDNADPNG